ncbi:DgyrCDS3313 [Dimorphilus gyrociliatus]|uniref:DgyrCDS3313 n=1 Tax=Dimorphilus gyrociliatus TaxID=2664684 RepID=A0A7I8VEM6_9ANNE|nr:DgyrCDS3313 [Dimorphilus gyrociliatus]
MICDGMNTTLVGDEFDRDTTKIVIQNPNIEHLDFNWCRLNISYKSLTVLILINIDYIEIRFIKNSGFMSIRNGTFRNLYHLIRIQMNGNELILSEPFPESLSLTTLFLRNNRITRISSTTFAKVPSLTWLDLNGNLIKTIERSSFVNLRRIEIIDLSKNCLRKLKSEYFIGKNQTSIVTQFSIAHNPLTLRRGDDFLKGMKRLETLNLSGVEINSINLSENKRLRHVYFKKFSYCQFAPEVQVCQPKTDGLSSDKQLIDNLNLRYFVWVISILTVISNLFVMAYRVGREDRNFHSIFIFNLSAADLMVGLYLLMIASRDVMYRDKFIHSMHQWVYSNWCQITGFIAMLGSESSVIILAFMSIERFLTISYPYKKFVRTKMRALLCMTVIWVIGIILSAIPLFVYGRYFYGQNAVCLPLHIHDTFMTGWEFSALVFIGINFVAFMLIASTYSAMFINIRNTRKASAQPNSEKSFAIRFFFIVLTDACCWIPIIVLKILAFCDILIDRWYFLINPLLYSLSTPVFIRRAGDVSRYHWRRIVPKSLSLSQPRRSSAKTSAITGALSLENRKKSTIIHCSKLNQTSKGNGDCREDASDCV